MPMLIRRLSLSLLAVLALVMATCVQPPESSPDTDSETTVESPRQQSSAPNPFHARLLEIAQNYEVYGYLLEKQMRPAPIVCDFSPSRFIQGITPANKQMKFSSSYDSGTHGKKLYLVFSKHPLLDLPELDLPPQPQPVGQAIVKESWVPEKFPPRRATRSSES
jgi:hypothetical protein